MTHCWQDSFKTYARRTLDLYLCPGLTIGLAEGGMEPMPPTELTPTGPGRFQSKNKETLTSYRFHFDSQGHVWAVSVGVRMLRRSHGDTGPK